MAEHSIAEYLQGFLARGSECAYAQREGYRTIHHSYRQIAEAAFQFTRELERRQIGKGQQILLWGPGSAEWVVAFFGCALRGVVVVPIDDASNADFAQRISQQVNSHLAVCSQDHAAAFSAQSVLLLEDLFAEVSAHSRANYTPAEINRDDVLEIVFTSGTTAEPKGVVITHANVLGNVAPLEKEIRKYLKYERFVHPVRFLNLLPLSHVFGQFLGIFLPQIMGGVVVFQDTLKPAEIIATIKRERISVLVSVPRVLQSLQEKIERDLEDAGQIESFHGRFEHAKGKHCLRRWWIFRHIHHRFGWKFWAFISGGAALNRTTEEFWGRLGYAVIQGYGLTETTSIISVNHPFQLGKGSIGKVLAGREVKLASDGEILVRGSGVAAGYFQANQLRPVATEEGWYHTGDIGELDAAGHLYFKGRKKEVIVTPAGMNVYPEDLEAALRRQPKVKDCVIVPLPQDGNAEPCAVLILREENTDAARIVKQANESLAEYQHMNHWFVWPESDFPRTSTLKPKLNEIQRTVQDQLSHAASGTPRTTSPLTEMIAQVTGRRIADLPANANLDSDLNLSSLDRVQLLSALEDRYQVDLSETKFSAVNTVGGLERMLHGQPPPRVHYHYPAWVQRWPVTWVRLFAQYALIRPAVFLLGWPHIEGRENLRGVQGPILVICNHIDDVDPGFVQTALPARFRNNLATAAGGEALEILRTPPAQRNLVAKMYDRLQWTLGVSLLNLFPLPRAAGFRESFAYAGQAVDRGYSILVFPEGHHTTNGKLLPFQAGVGILAKNLHIPVVPMRIHGLFEIKQAGKKFAPPGKIMVRIGKPLSFDPDADPAQIAQQLQQTVEDLCARKNRAEPSR